MLKYEYEWQLRKTFSCLSLRGRLTASQFTKLVAPRAHLARIVSVSLGCRDPKVTVRPETLPPPSMYAHSPFRGFLMVWGVPGRPGRLPPYTLCTGSIPLGPFLGPFFRCGGLRSSFFRADSSVGVEHSLAVLLPVGKQSTYFEYKS